MTLAGSLAARLRRGLASVSRRASAPGEPAPPLRVERHAVSLAGLGPEALRALIEELNLRSGTVGCVVFGEPRQHERVCVVFAGNLERFFMLAAVRALACPVIYVQDPVSYWYQGSALVPDLDTFCRTFLVPEIGPARALLFGQSSGAYAALVAAGHLRGATAVACAPQTFSDAATKGRIRFVGIRALHAPEGLIDLRQRLAAQEDAASLRAVIIAAGELDNPATAHWWGDYLHMLRLADVPGVSTFVVNANTHVIVHGRVNRFADLLARLAEALGAPPEVRAGIVEEFLVGEFGRGAG